MVTFAMWYDSLATSVMAAPEVIAFIIFVLILDQL
jgi:hypothetical protein